MPVIYRDKTALDVMRPRIDKDVYQTPRPLADAFVSALLANWSWPRDIRAVLDPGCGNGVWGEAVLNWYQRVYQRGEFSPRVDGVDIRNVRQNPRYSYWKGRHDFAVSEELLNAPYDLIIGNPPFNHAEEFIYQSRERLSQSDIPGRGGLIAFLLPSHFLFGQNRCRGLYTHYRPRHIIYLAQRPNFTGPRGQSLGQANTDTYVFGVWASENSGTTYTHWLDWKTDTRMVTP